MKTYRNLPVVLLLFLTALLVVPVPVRAATLTVTDIADSGAGTLRNTIAAAAAGDIIIFAPALNGQTIVLTSGQIGISNHLTINAAALPGGIQINGHASSRIFQVFGGYTVTLDSLTITNGAGSTGGGLLNDGTLTMNRCTMVNNHCPAGDGGGIYNTGTLTVNDSSLLGNSCPGRGGGICLAGLVASGTLNRSTLAGNSAGLDGGGIVNGGSTLAVNQCTITSNTAPVVGAIFNEDGRTLALNHSTVFGNSGGSIHNHSGDSPAILTLSNSIVAGSTEWVDISNQGTVTRFGSNIVQSVINDDDFGFGTDSGPAVIEADPLLAPLGDYGGPTRTMPPVPGSPALDGCPPLPGLTTDQRGHPRPQDNDGDTIAVADIGAVEGVHNPAGPGVLTGLSFPRPGWVRFEFTQFAGNGPFTVLATTNLTAPVSEWSNLGLAVEAPVGSGEFLFTDKQATLFPHRFYRATKP